MVAFGWMIEQNFSADYPRNYRIRREGAPAELQLTSQSPETHAAQCLSGPIGLSDAQASPARTHRLALMRAPSLK